MCLAGRAARSAHCLGALAPGRGNTQGQSRSRSRPHPSPSPDRVRERPGSPQGLAASVLEPLWRRSQRPVRTARPLAPDVIEGLPRERSPCSCRAAAKGIAMAEAIRLVVWDLDGTFWDGTILEGGIQYHQRTHDIVVALARRGIMSSICSKNDHATIKDILCKSGLWDYFVFP